MKKSEISVLNVLFCLMVIFIHVTAAPITSIDCGKVIVKILYFIQRMCGVAVHGFVFLSGLKLFLKDTSSISYPTYLFSRFKKIFLPYSVIAVLYYLYGIFRGNFVFSIRQLLTFVFTGSGEAHLYFVFVIMQLYILFPLWHFLLEKVNKYALITIAGIINIFCIYNLPQMLEHIGIFDNFSYNHGLFTSYLLIWTLGCLCGKHYDDFVRLAVKYRLVFGIASSLLLLADVYMSFNVDYYGAEFLLFKFVRIIYLVIMIMFLYGQFSNCKFKIFDTALFHSINNASYEIYLFHVFVIYALNDYLKAHFQLSDITSYIINFVVVYISSIGLCVLYKTVVRRVKK